MGHEPGQLMGLVAFLLVIVKIVGAVGTVGAVAGLVIAERCRS